jgi:hypothetical protein
VRTTPQQGTGPNSLSIQIITKGERENMQPSSPMTTEINDKLQEPQMALHWLVVGYVSPGAEKWIKDAGGQVLMLSHSAPLLIAVGLAYDPRGAWTWSKGRQEYRQGIEYWSHGELQEASTGITLRYGNASDPRIQAEYCSCETNYLILPDEEYDPQTGQIKEPGMYGQPLESVPDEPDDSDVGDGNSFPFADTDDLEDLDDFPF